MNILIAGAGHMGKWLIEELKSDHNITVFDPLQPKIAPHKNVTILSSIEEAAKINTELFINAVSLNHTIAAFEKIIPQLNTDCLIADLASVKTGLKDFYRKSGKRFVSVHPMFGPTFGNLEDLSAENAIIISKSDEEGKAFFRKLFSRLKINIFEYSFEEHDKTTAYSLSTPFISTLVFAACMKKQEAPGTTFKKHLKIADGLLAEDDALLSEILFNPFSLEQIEKINSRLSYLTHIIKGRDEEEMVKFLNGLRENLGK